MLTLESEIYIDGIVFKNVGNLIKKQSFGILKESVCTNSLQLKIIQFLIKIFFRYLKNLQVFIMRTNALF